MIEFLRQVTQHYFNEDFSKLLFVFPNRRSEVFFRKYLSEEVVSQKKKALFAPFMTTISELFTSLYSEKGRLADKITLLLELYEVYAQNYHGERLDTVDEFIFWGDVILNDFNDVDKYKADPSQIFTNISDLKGMEDDFSYLSPTQAQAMATLVGSLKGRGGEGKKYHKEFMNIWNVLLPVYKQFNKTLEDNGIAYEGMVFRSVSNSLKVSSAIDLVRKSFPGVEKVVFVGLNALTECEKDLLKALHDQGVAEFCWDYPKAQDKAWISDPLNKSSFFMKSNVERFPNAFTPQAEDNPKINVVSVASDVAQAKLLPYFIKESSSPEKTVVVLPDEGLLNPVLTSIPEDVPAVNITMGYPLTNTQAYTFVQDLCSLFDVRKSGYFYHRPVWNILSSSLYTDVLTKEQNDKVKDVKGQARTYIKKEDLEFSPVFDLPAKEDIQAVCRYLKTHVEFVARNSSFEREQQALFEILKCIAKLEEKKLKIEFSTFKSLLLSLIGVVSLPFKGEPVQGLQIMGPLEIRALDFENVVILSSMEGVFPRKSVSNSFIPYIIRSAFNLPTYEFQDAVWAYYFYRLIRRAKTVWMVYDNVADGLKSGEQSRYIMQLTHGYNADVHFFNAQSLAGVSYEYNEVDKTALSPEATANFNSYVFSASGLQSYLQCPLMFYYKHIERLYDKDEVDEDVQANQLGTVVHDTMETLYKDRDTISKDYINSLKKDQTIITATIIPHLKEQLRTDDIEGRSLIALQTARRYVNAILDEDLRQLGIHKTDEFRVLGLERPLTAKLGDHEIKGFIDRIDSFEDGVVRVVDYKTGHYEAEDINPVTVPPKKNVQTTLEKLFTGVNGSTWPKIALQLWIYDYLILNSDDAKDIRKHFNGPEDLRNVIYCPYKLASKGCAEGLVNPEFYDGCLEKTTALLDEIKNPGVPFSSKKGAVKACDYCDFKSLCKK